ncbi:MAG: hypothetical protein HC881_24515 [Leptolyngbyaceae cyanobacterium SL_7_1]|nr:hypothetical protein [Leptolyngbyaceae cyanobacterium SL_7_1]
MMTIDNVAQLAKQRGYHLKIVALDNQCFYWIENLYFTGNPYNSLRELALFIQQLPIVTPPSRRCQP